MFFNSTCALDEYPQFGCVHVTRIVTGVVLSIVRVYRSFVNSLDVVTSNSVLAMLLIVARAIR